MILPVQAFGKGDSKMKMTRRKAETLGLGLLAVLACSLCLGMAVDMKTFGKKSDKEKAKFLETWTETQKRELANMVKHFDENWQKEGWHAKAGFCRMVGQFRIKAAVPTLVRHLDFLYLGEFIGGYEGPKRSTENRPALDALIEIGMPALEPSAEHILRELDKLPSEILNKDDAPKKGVTDKQRWRVSFLRQALQKLSTDILGKDLAVVFLKKQLEQKGRGKGARKGIEYALSKIEKQ